MKGGLGVFFMAIEQNINKVLEMIYRETTKTQDIVYSGLVEGRTVNRIPESLFVNYFLPCFLGQRENPNWIMEWISIAGTPMAEVDVFDDNTKQILFTVPSVLNSNRLLLSNQGANINDIFSRYEQINNNMPINSLNFLISALNEKGSQLLSSVNNNEPIQKWIYILKRYGYINEQQQQSSNEPQQLDFFEY